MLNEAALRNIGFNDPNVINHILNNPAERARYERELNLQPSDPYDLDSQISRAYDELGSYYDRILTEAKGDTDLALSRLKEDYDTGKRFAERSADLNEEILSLAREDMISSIDSAKRTLLKSQISRGIYRNSQFTPDQNMGVATAEQNRLAAETGRAESRQNIREADFALGQEQDTLTRDTALSRGTEDLNRRMTSYAKDLEEERKQKATQLGSSRSQRAYQRFESGLT